MILKRIAIASVVLAAATVQLATASPADAMVFDASGSFLVPYNAYGVFSFSGNLSIDTVTGQVNSADISAGTFGHFTSLTSQTAYYLFTSLVLAGSDNLFLQLAIYRDTPPGDLVGLNDGHIRFGAIANTSSITFNSCYNYNACDFTGEVIPLPPVTPLPSSWTMMILGLVGLGYMEYRRHKRITIHTA